MSVHRTKLDWHLAVLALALAAVIASRAHSYLLFHTLAELFWIVVAFTAFAISWNGRRHLENTFLLVSGIALGPSATLSVLHTLAYKGMGVFPSDANLPTQLWIAARGLEAASMLAAALLCRHRVSPSAVLAVSSAAAMVVAGAIFAGLFPDCFVEGTGLTRFKVATEYAIIATFGAAALLLFPNRDLFPHWLFRLLVMALILGMLEEAAFTLYTDVYGVLNMVGHLLGILFGFLLYTGVVRLALARPQEVMFHALHTLNENLAGQALRHGQRAALAVEAVGGGVWESDQAAPNFALSQRHGAWLGFAPDIIPESADWSRRILPEDLPAYEALLQPRADEIPRSAEYRIRLAGGLSWFQTVTRAVAVDGKRVLIGLDQDITARKRDEMERAAMAEDLRRFSMILAHHLQEPVRLQANYVQLLERNLPQPVTDRQAEIIRIIRGNADHLRQLLHGAYLYLSAPRGVPPEPCADPAALAREAWKRLGTTDGKLELAPLPPLWLGAAQMAEVLSILFSNAVENGTPGRPPIIRVSADDQHDETVLHVADNGVGIEPDYHARIFEPFERLQNRLGHPGIGLALARRMVEGAGGRIWVTSAPGQGATFHIALPKPVQS